MPIIQCTDCKKEMSDAAPACPNCGRPNNKTIITERPVGALLKIGIFLLPIVFSWVTLKKGYTTPARVISFAWLAITLIIATNQDNSKNTPPPPYSPPAYSNQKNEQPAEVIEVNIQQIISDYKNNEVNADNKYKGRIVQVTGIVGHIKKDIMNSLYVTLGTGSQFEIPEIQAFFDDSMNNQLSELKQGQNLTVVCKITGLMMNIHGKECIIR